MNSDRATGAWVYALLFSLLAGAAGILMSGALQRRIFGNTIVKGAEQFLISDVLGTEKISPPLNVLLKIGPALLALVLFCLVIGGAFFIYRRHGVGKSFWTDASLVVRIGFLVSGAACIGAFAFVFFQYGVTAAVHYALWRVEQLGRDGQQARMLREAHWFQSTWPWGKQETFFRELTNEARGKSKIFDEMRRGVAVSQTNGNNQVSLARRAEVAFFTEGDPIPEVGRVDPKTVLSQIQGACKPFEAGIGHRGESSLTLHDCLLTRSWICRYGSSQAEHFAVQENLRDHWASIEVRGQGNNRLERALIDRGDSEWIACEARSRRQLRLPLKPRPDVSPPEKDVSLPIPSHAPEAGGQNSNVQVNKEAAKPDNRKEVRKNGQFLCVLGSWRVKENAVAALTRAGQQLPADQPRLKLTTHFAPGTTGQWHRVIIDGFEDRVSAQQVCNDFNTRPFSPFVEVSR